MRVGDDGHGGVGVAARKYKPNFSHFLRRRCFRFFVFNDLFPDSKYHKADLKINFSFLKTQHLK